MHAHASPQSQCGQGRVVCPGCRNEAVVADAAERRAALVVGPSGVPCRGDAGGVGSEIVSIGRT